jgi:hypothetical protein
MTSPLEIPIEARIIVVSKSDTFRGITGLDQFEGHAAATQSYRSMVGGATYVN